MIDPWPFDQPRNCATLTSTHVMNEGKLITHVYHDEDDHGWQFHSAEGATMENSLLVTLESVISQDPTLLQVADLPPGWLARRSTKEEPWQIEQQYADATPVLIDWSKLQTEEQFYDSILPQCGSPAWHGRNLDALHDSWVTGGIDTGGPPYAFRFIPGDSTTEEMARFRAKVQEIARDSVDENGGRYEETGSDDLNSEERI
jgi:RNAse (barnase) inhibitor barstar